MPIRRGGEEGRVWKILHRCVAGAAAVLGLALPAAAASAAAGVDATTARATIAKKKCQKAPWRCAPRRYHLEASGILAPGGVAYGHQTWSAEVELNRRRASLGEVDYAQVGGTVTLSATYEFDDCYTSPGPFSVRGATIAVPPESLNESDFKLFFSLLGKHKGTYDLVLGAVQPELSNIQTTGAVYCPGGSRYGTSFQYPYWFINSDYIPSEGRGKPGKSPLTGSGSLPRVGSLKWKLTKK
jgi:hypothetical protein